MYYPLTYTFFVSQETRVNEQIYLKALKESNDTTNQWRWFIHLYSRNRMKFVTINRDQSINAKGVKGDRFGKTDSFEIYIVNPTVSAKLRGCHGLAWPFRLVSTSQVVSSPMGVLRVEQNATVANVPHCLHKPDPISVLKAERRNSNTESLKAHR